MKMKKLCTILILVWVAATGCGDVERVSMPGDKNRQVSELSETELRDICKESIGAFVAAYGSDLCSAVAVGLGDHARCAATRDRCLDGLDVSVCDKMKIQPMSCDDVTVGEMERCLNDSLALYDSLPSISCSSMNTQDAEQALRGFQTVAAPASCKAMAGRCNPSSFYETSNGSPAHSMTRAGAEQQ